MVLFLISKFHVVSIKKKIRIPLKIIKIIEDLYYITDSVSTPANIEYYPRNRKKNCKIKQKQQLSISAVDNLFK